jgi:hypothetical protein
LFEEKKEEENSSISLSTEMAAASSPAQDASISLRHTDTAEHVRTDSQSGRHQMPDRFIVGSVD